MTLLEAAKSFLSALDHQAPTVQQLIALRVAIAEEEARVSANPVPWYRDAAEMVGLVKECDELRAKLAALEAVSAEPVGYQRKQLCGVDEWEWVACSKKDAEFFSQYPNEEVRPVFAHPAPKSAYVPMSVNELKPCPFCRGEAEFKQEPFMENALVKCRKCEVRTRLKWDNEVVANWNHRPIEDALRTELEELVLRAESQNHLVTDLRLQNSAMSRSLTTLRAELATAKRLGFKP